MSGQIWGTVEILISLVFGMMGIMGLSKARDIWRARNGGYVTWWIVLLLIMLGTSLSLFPLAVMGQHHYEIHVPALLRTLLWVQNSMALVGVLSFVFKLVPLLEEGHTKEGR